MNSILPWPHREHTLAVHKMFSRPYRPDTHRRPPQTCGAAAAILSGRHLWTSTFCFLLVGHLTGGLCWSKPSCFYADISSSSSWTEIFIKPKCEVKKRKIHPSFSTTASAYKQCRCELKVNSENGKWGGVTTACLLRMRSENSFNHREQKGEFHLSFQLWFVYKDKELGIIKSQPTLSSAEHRRQYKHDSELMPDTHLSRNTVSQLLSKL